MSGDPLGLYDYRPGDSSNILLQKILRAAAALPGSMGIPEAPIDGQPYARMNAGWVVAAGGVSVIAGVVDVHADLPVTVGSPVVNSAYLVRESSGAWLPFYDTRKAGGIWVRQFNNGNLDDWVYSGELQATQNAANFTVYDPTDPTKEIGFSAAGITAGARRILTPLNKNYTLEETGHAAKHQNGGSDEINVGGLPGVLADPQPPIIGATGTTAVAGNDARLTDARTPTAHKTSHENGGTDEINVGGLSGVLADPQPPIIGAGATQAVAGNDARLTDERVPTAAGLTSKFGTNKATLVDGDKVAILDSEAADVPKHGLWSLIKSTLKTYFDTIYQAAGSYLTSGGALGTPSSGTLTNCTADGTDAVGFRNVPANSQSAAYTTVLADAGKAVDHPSTDANARTFTIDSNANVAYPTGTCITFTNMTSQAVTIAITDDTMYLAGTGTTGSRTLAQYGIATARKLTSTTWLISGTGLT